MPDNFGVVVDWVSVGLSQYADLDGTEWADSPVAVATTCSAEGFTSGTGAPDPDRAVSTLLPPSAIHDGRGYYAQVRSVSRSGRARVRTIGPLYVDSSPPESGFVSAGDNFCEEGENTALRPGAGSIGEVETLPAGAHPCPFNGMITLPATGFVGDMQRRRAWRHANRLSVRIAGFGDAQSGLGDVHVAVGDCGSNPEAALPFTSVQIMPGWQNGEEVDQIDVTMMRRKRVSATGAWEMSIVSIPGLQLQNG